MAIPVPFTFTANDHATAARVNTYKDAINYLLAPPRVRAYRTTDQSIPDATNTVINWDAEDYDDTTRPSHDTATNNSRLTAPEDGLYRVTLQLSYASNATGRRFAGIRKNGTTQLAQVNQNATSGAASILILTADILLAATDYLEALAFQTSGGSLAVSSGTGNSYFAWQWVALS